MKGADNDEILYQKSTLRLVSSRRVSRSDGGGLKTLCIKMGYSESTGAESREGSSALSERSWVT